MKHLFPSRFVLAASLAVILSGSILLPGCSSHRDGEAIIEPATTPLDKKVDAIQNDPALSRTQKNAAIEKAEIAAGTPAPFATSAP